MAQKSYKQLQNMFGGGFAAKKALQVTKFKGSLTFPALLNVFNKNVKIQLLCVISLLY